MVMEVTHNTTRRSPGPNGGVPTRETGALRLFFTLSVKQLFV
jgi:hypothetical protein